MNIIGFYKQWVLIERDGKFCVVNKAGKKVLFVGSEEAASKLFVMLATGFINEEYKG